MPIPELQNFRAKYPGYDDIDDTTLATKLAAKYPDAYGDLPDKLGTVTDTRYDASTSAGAKRFQSERQKFINQEDDSLTGKARRVLQNPYVKPFVRTGLEGAGIVGGGMIGAGAGPVGAVGGAALGFGMGKGLADLALGENQVDTLPQAATKTLGDVATGATMEMGGQVLGKVIGSGMTTLKQWKAQGMPWSDKRHVYDAGNQLGELLQSGNPAQKQEADALLGRLGTEENFTPGQSSGSYAMASKEQSLAKRDYELGDALKHNDAALNAAAQNNLLKAVGSGSEAPLNVYPPQEIGSNIRSTLNTGLKGFRQAEDQIWSKVPQYNIPSTNFDAATQSAVSSPQVEDTLNAVKGMVNYAGKMPRTTEGLRDIERTVGGEITKAYRKGDTNTARVLQDLKHGVQADFAEMGKAADAGDVAVFDNRLIYPSKIKAELDTIPQKIGDLSNKVSSQNSFQQMLNELRASGAPVMKQINESESAFQQRITGDYLKKFGEKQIEMPLNQVTSKEIEALQQRQQTLQGMLDNAQPADNVAKAIQDAKRVSLARFERYNRGGVADALKIGDEFSGYALRDETVPAIFMRPSDTDQLVRAVGKGKAAEQMMPYLQSELQSNTVGNNGVMNIPRALAYVRKNAGVIDKLGLGNQIDETLRSQFPTYLKDQLAAKGVDIEGNPVMTALQARKMSRELKPALTRLYGADSPAVKAMDDYQQMLEILGRNKNVSYSGGSTTSEALSGSLPISQLLSDATNNIATLGAVATGHGWIYSASRNLFRGLFHGTLQYQEAQVEKLLKDAIVNPASAELIMKMARGAKVAPSVIDSHLVSLGIVGADNAVQGE